VAVLIPFPLPATGYAKNRDVRVNLQAIVDKLNQFNTGAATWDNVSVGTANSGTGTITLYSDSSTYYLTLQPGAIAENATYTLPISLPTVDGQLLAATMAGVMSWAEVVDYVSGTANQVTVTDDGDGTLTLSLPQDIHTGASPSFNTVTLTASAVLGLLYGNDANPVAPLQNATGTNAILRASSTSTPKYVTLLGTADQITVTHNTANTTLSLPQAIATSSNVAFNRITCTGGNVTNPSFMVGTGTGTYGTATELSLGVAGVKQGAVDNAGGLTMNGELRGATVRATTEIQLTTGASEILTLQSGATEAWTLTLPVDAGNNLEVLTTDGNGVTAWTPLSGIGATTALDNLASVAINTSLISDTDNTDDLGDATHDWKDIYFQGALKSGAATLATATEVGYLSGVTSAIQTQLSSKPTADLSDLTPGAVAINTSLLSDTANTDDLGSNALPWRSLFLKTYLVLQETGAGSQYIYFSAPADVTDSYPIVFPAAQGGANEILQNDGGGNLSWVTVSAAGGATTALDNLASVAINTTLLPGVAGSIDLGSSAKWFSDLQVSNVIIRDSDVGVNAITIAAPAGVTNHTLTLPGTQGSASTLLQNDGSGNLSWVTVSAAGGATKALNNLASVAVNTGIIPDTDSTWALGSTTLAWTHLYLTGSIYNNSVVCLTTNAIGAVTQPLQPSFLATAPANTADVTGDGTSASVEFDTEVYDLNSDFNTGTYTFTAPVTGKYQFNANVLLQGLTSSHTYFQITLTTSNRSYIVANNHQAASQYNGVCLSALADMDANDTAILSVIAYGGTKVVEPINSAAYNTFSGSLIN